MGVEPSLRFDIKKQSLQKQANFDPSGHARPFAGDQTENQVPFL